MGNLLCNCGQPRSHCEQCGMGYEQRIRAAVGVPPPTPVAINTYSMTAAGMIPPAPALAASPPPAPAKTRNQPPPPPDSDEEEADQKERGSHLMVQKKWKSGGNAKVTTSFF